MKHLTKIFVGLAIILFIVGYYLQATGHENQGIKLLLAAIMFMICAFINRSNDRRKNKKWIFNRLFLSVNTFKESILMEKSKW